MRVKGGLIIVWIWVLSLVAPLVCLAQTTPDSQQDKLEAAHAALLEDPAMQFDRPEIRTPEPPRERRDRNPFWQNLGDFLSGLFSILAPIFRFVFYAILVLGVGWILFYLIGRFAGMRGSETDKVSRKVEEDVLEITRPDASVARSLLEEADALAKDGRYAEAVHLLLFRSIDEIQTRRARALPRSLTAREIGDLPTLPDSTKTALGPIISVVERSFFGGRSVDEAGWQDARKSYERFVFGASA